MPTKWTRHIKSQYWCSYSSKEQGYIAFVKVDCKSHIGVKIFANNRFYMFGYTKIAKDPKGILNFGVTILNSTVSKFRGCQHIATEQKDI